MASANAATAQSESSMNVDDSAIQVGDTVLVNDASEFPVSVVEKINGDTAILKKNVWLKGEGWTNTVALSKLVKSVPCLGRVCQGDTGAYIDYYVTSVTHVFRNGMLEIPNPLIQTQNKVIPIEKFGKFTQCNRQNTICTDDEVLLYYSELVTIINFIDDHDGEKAWVQYPGTPKAVVPVKKLLAGLPKHRYVGKVYAYYPFDSVKGPYRATVHNVFPNGTASVQIHGKHIRRLVSLKELHEL